MTPITATRPHNTQVNANNPRRGALDRSRRHGALLAYEGVTETYIRDIASRAARTQPCPDESPAAAIR
jgi:hypothetical protein